MNGLSLYIKEKLKESKKHPVVLKELETEDYIYTAIDGQIIQVEKTKIPIMIESEPMIMENEKEYEIDWHLDDAMKMNTNEWVDFDRVDMDKLEKLLDEYMNEYLNKKDGCNNELVNRNEKE